MTQPTKHDGAGGFLGLALLLCSGAAWYYIGCWAAIGVFIFLAMVIGITASDVRAGRVTHCYACKRHLDGSVHGACRRCGWIRCPLCGACGCGYGRL